IKVLPDAFARDPERLSRFEREARLLAAMTHPNIAGIYGLEEAAGKSFLVLEYVAGETLGDRLARGPLSIAETIDVGRQIATALEAAHEAGIIHRDLKPGNIKLTPGGDVKVLDFGLARGAEGVGDSSSVLQQSPTLSLAATAAGVILGTAAYMSPEQARGRPVDRRTDIWSFGCVLYECLTGRQAFPGETVSDSIAKILQSEPDASALPEGVPPRLRQMLARCLEKEARRRLRDIGDARIEFEEMQGGRASGSSSLVPAPADAGSAAVATRPTHRRLLPVAAAVLLAAAAGALLLWAGLGPLRHPPRALRYTIAGPPGTDFAGDAVQQAISPDGRLLAFVTLDSSLTSELWLRPLDQFEPRRLPGTRKANLPFWSPDSRSLAFFADGKLQRLSVGGGNPEIICEAPNGRGGSWGKKDIIVFAPTSSGPLFRVAAGGGRAEAVTVIDSTAGETAHRWPCFLPDGEHFLFLSLPFKAGAAPAFVAALGRTGRSKVLEAQSAPVFAAPGFLLFERNAALMAQRFDARARRVRGEPFRVGPPAQKTSYSGSPSASVSTNGVLCSSAKLESPRRLAWLDRAGQETGTIDVPIDNWDEVAVAPDGRRAVVGKTGSEGYELWLLEIRRSTMTKLTFDRFDNTGPVWSTDGSEIIYSSNRAGVRDLYRRHLDVGDRDAMFHHSAVQFKDAGDWTPDGQWVVMEELTADRGSDISLIPAAGGAARSLLDDPFNE
ncbi:MAG: protein kinase, partial [Candidatus Eisenbacteria bacterium]